MPGVETVAATVDDPGIWSFELHSWKLAQEAASMWHQNAYCPCAGVDANLH
jgi:hypothetical protein